jgi:hypothetical protein
MNERPADTDDTVSYAYRPSLLGAPWEFKLTESTIDWAVGAMSGRIPFSNIRRLRMSYRPMSMQSYRFVTELWAEGTPKLQIVSCSWKSLVEQKRLDETYSAFVSELHRRIAVTAAPVRFEQGANPFVYWPGLIVFVAAALGLAALIAHGLQAGAARGAALVGGFLVLLLLAVRKFLSPQSPARIPPRSAAGRCHAAALKCEEARDRRHQMPTDW